MATSQTFRQIAQRVERRAVVINLLEEIAADDPEFLPELAGVLAESRGATKPPRRRTPPKAPAEPTNYDRIVKLFNENDNRWMTVDSIVARLGGKKNTIGHIIYHSKKEDFESRSSLNGPRMFRLKKGDEDDE